MPEFSKLTVSRENGAVLVEPSLTQMCAHIADNRHASRNYTLRCCGEDYTALRERVRRQLGVHSGESIVLLGHQPEFFHCGVWAKSVVAQLLIQQIGASAIQVCIDHDKIKRRYLSVPLEQSGQVEFRQINALLDPSIQLYEQAAAWTSAQIAEFRQQLQSEYSAYGSSELPVFFEALDRAPATDHWVVQYIFALQQVDAGFDIRLAHRRASGLDYGLFFGALIADASHFAACYNQALAAYRLKRRIKGTQHPIPDLSIENERVELPIWAHNGNGSRERMYVGVPGSRCTLYAGDLRIAEFSAECFDSVDGATECLAEVSAAYVLRPRALTFTLWARLFAGDYFIHGIGGAKYDQITDELIRLYYGIEPPHYACVSTTLWLDLPRRPASIDQLQHLYQRRRDQQFNPQRYVADDHDARQQVERRQALIAEALRLRTQSPKAHARRRQLFNDIRAANRALQRYLNEPPEALDARVSELRQQLHSNVAACSREYFYCLHTHRALADLRQRIEHHGQR